MGHNNKVVRAGIGYTVGNVLVRGLSFITLPIFTRLMSTEDYGLYTTYVAYESILTLIIGLGLHSSLKAAKIEFGDRLDSYVSSVCVLPIILTCIIAIILIPFLSAVASLFGFTELIVLMMLVQALASAIFTMYNCRVSLDYAYKSYLAVSLANSAGNITLSLALILSVCSGFRYLGRILGTAIPLIIIAIGILVSFWRKSRPVHNAAFSKFGLKYSLPLVPHGLSQVALAQFGRIIIQRYVGNAAVGIYGFAFTIALIPQILVQSLDNAWGPWFFEQYDAGNVTKIRVRSTQYTALFSAATVFLFAVSPEIIKMMSEVDYWDASYIVCPAILGVYFTFLYGLPAQIEYFYKKTIYLAIGTAVAAIINIIGCIVLVPLYSYQSAVYVTAVTYAIYFIAHMLIANKLTGGDLPFETVKIVTYAISVIMLCCLMQATVDSPIVRYSLSILWCACCIFINRSALVEAVSTRLSRQR